MKRQTITLQEKYMVLPVNNHAKRKRITFTKGDKVVWEIYAPIDFQTPQYHTYLDVSHLLGEEVILESTPSVDISFETVDSIPASLDYSGNYRPIVHFTAKYGWLNDPNGLVQVHGIYHLFFQYNPTDSDATNIMWGHAISKDLIHWEQIDSAILPDERGMSFSGSGIVDKDNVSGLGKEEPPVLFFYTAAGGTTMLSEGKKFVQCLAYSTDGGMTLQKYEKNPVLEHVLDCNRDPKLVYSSELGCYVMALFLMEDEYALYTSTDLLHFTELQRLHLVGDSECPNLYPVSVEGEANAKKWIFSGAHDCYVVGEFVEGKFTEVQPSTPYAYACPNATSYAAQVFSDVEDGRQIRMAWQWLRSPDPIFEGQMGIPTEITLATVGEKYRLRTLPCKEFKGLYQWEDNYPIREKFGVKLPKKAYALHIQAEKNSGDFLLRFFGYEMHVQISKNLLVFDGKEVPLSYTGEVDLQIISDVLGLEIFLDNGLIYTMYSGLADYGIDDLVLEGEGLCAKLTVAPLKGIWEKK